VAVNLGARSITSDILIDVSVRYTYIHYTPRDQVICQYPQLQMPTDVVDLTRCTKIRFPPLSKNSHASGRVGKTPPCLKCFHSVSQHWASICLAHVLNLLRIYIKNFADFIAYNVATSLSLLKCRNSGPSRFLAMLIKEPCWS
jgi:hypothetical protein